MSTDQHDLIRPTPYKRDPRVAQHGKHREERPGTVPVASLLPADRPRRTSPRVGIAAGSWLARYAGEAS